MKTKVIPIFLACIVLFLIAAAPLQEEPAPTLTWQDVFKTIIFLVIAAAGAPVTQVFKNMFKLEDRWALLLTGGVAAVIAVLEMWLAGVLDFTAITLQNFPTAFFAVFSVATIYYQLLKGADNFFGKGVLLKRSGE